jgi:hypothetical protein
MATSSEAAPGAPRRRVRDPAEERAALDALQERAIRDRRRIRAVLGATREQGATAVTREPGATSATVNRELRDAAPRERAAATSTARQGFLPAVERVVLATVAAIIGVNVWSGLPLLALWVGSRAAHGSALSMRGIVVALAALAALMVIALATLAWISDRYDHLTGRDQAPRQPAPWMRSMRADRDEVLRIRRRTNGIERIVVFAVVVGVLAFEGWFFVFAGNSFSPVSVLRGH